MDGERGLGFTQTQGGEHFLCSVGCNLRDKFQAAGCAVQFESAVSGIDSERNEIVVHDDFFLFGLEKMN